MYWLARWNSVKLWLEILPKLGQSIMVDNLRGDPGRPPQALSPARNQPGPQEASPYLGKPF